MKFHKKHALHEAAAQEETRYAIAGVRVRGFGDGYVAEATDGRIYARVPVEDGVNLEDKIMPHEAWQVAQTIARRPGKTEGADTCTAAIESCVPPVGTQPPPFFDVWDHKKGVHLQFPALDVRFPDVDAVVPKGTEVLRIGLNPQLLLQLAKAIGAAGPLAEMTAVNLVVYADSVEKTKNGQKWVTGPIEVRPVDTHDPKTMGVIMPIGPAER